MSELLSLSNPVLRNYIFYGSVLVAKMVAMSWYAGTMRFIKGAFINPEDSKQFRRPLRSHEDVERVRRAHLNDLETIPPFLIAAGFYVLTNPSPILALNLFRIFTAARFAHTLVYAVVVVRQPARGIAWHVASGVTTFIVIQNILAVIGYTLIFIYTGILGTDECFLVSSSLSTQIGYIHK